MLKYVCKKMNKKQKTIVLISLSIFIIVLHFVANTTGLYEGGIIWFDNVLHFLTGVVFGLTWLWIFRKQSVENYSLRDLISAFGFVLRLAIIWELLEFGFLKLFPVYAHSLSIFSPSITEAVEDIASNMLGVISLLVWIRVSLKLKEENIDNNHV